MKRDMGLIRKIMEAIEEGAGSNLEIYKVFQCDDPVKTDNRKVPIGGHLTLLEMSGFIDYTHNLNLTWKGHDWLDEQRAKESVVAVTEHHDIDNMPSKGSTMLPHEVDENGVCKWCNKQVLGPERNEVCRRRRVSEVSVATK